MGGNRIMRIAGIALLVGGAALLATRESSAGASLVAIGAALVAIYFSGKNGSKGGEDAR